MFRKIHSKRNPSDTLFTELRQEFAIHFNRFWQWFTALCSRYPKQVYGTMVLLILVSAICSFLIRGTSPAPAQKWRPSSRLVTPVADGFGQIMQKGIALKEAAKIKTQIEALILKDSLTGTDSILLEKSIDRLHELSISTQ